MRIRTKEDAQNVVDDIISAVHRRDYEVAHSLEDDLRTAVLRAIVNSELLPYEARDIGHIALSTSKIKFPRHSA